MAETAPQTIMELVAAAKAEAARGRWAEAEQLWRSVREVDPQNAAALLALAVHATQRGDALAAVELAKSAVDAAPRNPLAWLALSRARQTCGDDAAERAAIDHALELDPYFAPALLAKAAWFERAGAEGKAAFYYRTAVKVSPPEPAWPPALREELTRARQRAQTFGEALSRRLHAALSASIDTLAPPLTERWREAIAMRAGLSAPYFSQANQFSIPRLPAIPFFPRDTFPWAGAIEAQTEVICEELLRLLAEGGSGFAPYVRYEHGEPKNQFATLNGSPQWSAFHLYRYGRRDEANCVRAPRTLTALKAVDLIDAPGCPNVMFSLLAPKTHIPPHQGETNARAVAHLPLIVPERCFYRVGFERRSWRRGELLVFDDSIEHEARNDGEEIRVVLIFDVWNPLLSPAERQIARELLALSAAIP